MFNTRNVFLIISLKRIFTIFYVFWGNCECRGKYKKTLSTCLWESQNVCWKDKEGRHPVMFQLFRDCEQFGMRCRQVLRTFWSFLHTEMILGFFHKLRNDWLGALLRIYSWRPPCTTIIREKFARSQSNHWMLVRPVSSSFEGRSRTHFLHRSKSKLKPKYLILKFFI